MFFIKNKDTYIIGASPEVLVRVENNIVETRPIAGTRPRGKTMKEDKRLELELLSDPKEKAEHIMLVDLSRNDISKVCNTGTVKVTDFMTIERYSHVMHIVSNVKGKLNNKYNSIDVFKACFPAGTLSGAPKIRAMQIINELEPNTRGPYGGSVGYIGFSGNMDMSITIRSFYMNKDNLYFQAGAGIVADSKPKMELKETINKSGAMLKAIKDTYGKNRKILMIDNYDSFTYNLVHYIEEFGAKVNVVRNDEISINKIKKYKPDIIFISPGPCSPKEAGISVKIVKELAGKIPIFGVCLGHQSIGYAFGSEIIKAKKLLHGKTSKIYHNKKGIYKNLPNPFEATRYHSLIINKRTLPEDFEITSQTEDGTIMGILNKKLNIEGVQFHPESILTKQGKKLIKNILETKY